MYKILNEILCTTQVVMNNARNAHWNVRGNGFMGMHQFLDETIKLLFGFSDELAERIVMQGEIPTHTLKRYVEESIVSEESTVPDTPELLRGVHTDLGMLLNQIDLSLAEGGFSYGVSDMLSTMANELEERLYLLQRMIK